jgi:hypothetical protein
VRAREGPSPGNRARQTRTTRTGGWLSGRRARVSCSIGIPKEAGKFVVIAHGPPDEVRKTKGTLAAAKHQGMKEHACRA